VQVTKYSTPPPKSLIEHPPTVYKYPPPPIPVEFPPIPAQSPYDELLFGRLYIKRGQKVNPVAEDPTKVAFANANKLFNKLFNKIL